MGRREETLMVAVLHVLAVGLENLRVGAGLREDLAQHRQVQPEGFAQTEALRQASRVDVHDHVDERFDLGRLPSRADVTHRGTEFLKERPGALEDFSLATAHQVKGALARLGDARSHADLRSEEHTSELQSPMYLV